MLRIGAKNMSIETTAEDVLQSRLESLSALNLTFGSIFESLFKENALTNN